MSTSWDWLMGTTDKRKARREDRDLRFQDWKNTYGNQGVSDNFRNSIDPYSMAFTKGMTDFQTAMQFRDDRKSVSPMQAGMLASNGPASVLAGNTPPWYALGPMNPFGMVSAYNKQKKYLKQQEDFEQRRQQDEQNFNMNMKPYDKQGFYQIAAYGGPIKNKLKIGVGSYNQTYNPSLAKNQSNILNNNQSLSFQYPLYSNKRYGYDINAEGSIGLENYSHPSFNTEINFHPTPKNKPTFYLDNQFGVGMKNSLSGNLYPYVGGHINPTLRMIKGNSYDPLTIYQNNSVRTTLGNNNYNSWDKQFSGDDYFRTGIGANIGLSKNTNLKGEIGYTSMPNQNSNKNMYFGMTPYGEVKLISAINIPKGNHKHSNNHNDGSFKIFNKKENRNSHRSTRYLAYGGKIKQEKNIPQKYWSDGLGGIYPNKMYFSSSDVVKGIYGPPYFNPYENYGSLHYISPMDIKRLRSIYDFKKEEDKKKRIKKVDYVFDVLKGDTNHFKKAYGGDMNGQMIEAEGGEAMQYPNGQLQSIKGPTHEQGGVPMYAKEGTRIYTDRLKAPKELVNILKKL